MLRELDRPLIYGAGGQVEIQYRWGQVGRLYYRSPVLHLAPLGHNSSKHQPTMHQPSIALGENKKGLQDSSCFQFLVLDILLAKAADDSRAAVESHIQYSFKIVNPSQRQKDWTRNSYKLIQQSYPSKQSYPSMCLAYIRFCVFLCISRKSNPINDKTSMDPVLQNI